jgi:hypothetical protein
MTDWVEKRVDTTIAAAVKSVERSRFVFLIINIACVLTLVGQWNTTINWSTRVEEPLLRIAVADCPDDQSAGAATPKPGPQACTERQLEQKIVKQAIWSDYNFISVPLLGLRIHSDDICVLGPFALSVLVVWWWFVLRRENHAMRAVLALVRSHPGNADVGTVVRHAVGSAFVFLTASREDAPDWKAVASQVESTKARFAYRLLATGKDDKPGFWMSIPRRASQALHLLPFITAVVVLVAETVYISSKSSVYPDETRWRLLWRLSLFHHFAGRIVASFVLAVLIGAFVRQCIRWSVATTFMLEAMDKETTSSSVDGE